MDTSGPAVTVFAMDNLSDSDHVGVQYFVIIDNNWTKSTYIMYTNYHV